MLKVSSAGRRPADTHLYSHLYLRPEHLLQPGVHFFFPNELAAVGLCDALSDGGTEAGIFLKQAQSGILHQSLGIGACLGGNLRKLRFLLGGEMHFHRLQTTARPTSTQHLAKELYVCVARTLLSSSVAVAFAVAFCVVLELCLAGVVSAARFSRIRVSAPHDQAWPHKGLAGYFSG